MDSMPQVLWISVFRILFHFYIPFTLFKTGLALAQSFSKTIYKLEHCTKLKGRPTTLTK